MVESPTIESFGRTDNTAGRKHRRRMTLRESFEKHLDNYVGGQMYVTDEDPSIFKKSIGAYCGIIEAIAFEGDILNIHLSWAAKKLAGLGWESHDRLDYSFDWAAYNVEVDSFRGYLLKSRVTGGFVAISTRWAPHKVKPPYK